MHVTGESNDRSAWSEMFSHYSFGSFLLFLFPSSIVIQVTFRSQTISDRSVARERDQPFIVLAGDYTALLFLWALSEKQ